MGQELDPEVLSLIRLGISSVWTLEVLLLLAGAPGREWQEGEIVRELRASVVVVRDCLASLSDLGAAARTVAGGVIYAATGPLDRTVRGLAEAYQDRPVAVVKAIADAPDQRIRTFADAFRIRR